MLVELAIGDAYGAGFEYSPDEFVAEHNTLAGYVQHPRHLGIAPGQYTDDTQMTVAIAEQLLSGEAWTVENLADRFIACYHRDPRDGYSSGFHALLRAHHSGAGLRAALNPASDRSGAAMRTAPVGLLPDVEQVLRATETQARISESPSRFDARGPPQLCRDRPPPVRAGGQLHLTGLVRYRHLRRVSPDLTIFAGMTACSSDADVLGGFLPSFPR